MGPLPLPVGSSGTAKHAFVGTKALNGMCGLPVDNGWYCALPKDDSIHIVEGTIDQTPVTTALDKVREMFAPYVQHRTEPIRFPDHPTVQDVSAYYAECTELVREKNKTYSDAWKRQGYMGNLSRIMSKAARLQAMLWRDAEDGPPVPERELTESIEDTLRDLANLTAFMTLNYTEGNRWGA